LFGASWLVIASCAFACPRIGELIDYNCDGEHRIAITGDSIAYGITGQHEGEDDNYSGGYVERLAERFPIL